jgi:cytochrome c oxidase assembly protein subunit 11
MFAFGFALVPLYDVFCKITGLNGKTGQTEATEMPITRIDRGRAVTVEFVANVSAGFPWEFRPSVNKLQVHPGELKQTSFYAKNLSDKAVTGRAVPSVAPNHSARFFIKTECFCFTEQRLQAGEGKEMPVRFFVNPDLPIDVKTLYFILYVLQRRHPLPRPSPRRGRIGVGVNQNTIRSQQGKNLCPNHIPAITCQSQAPGR